MNDHRQPLRPASGHLRPSEVTIDGILVGLSNDDAGNLLSDETWTYTYDVENRLTV